MINNDFTKIKENIIIDLKNNLKLNDNDQCFIIRNIYSRFSLFFISENSNIIEANSFLQNNKYNNIIDTIEVIDDEFIISQLKLESTQLDDKFYYSERRSNSYNWFSHNEITKQNNIISFYSFKGGVGRTTSMVLSAIELVRKGHKIVLIDFDLEAPGLVSLFSNNNKEYYKVKGILDYLIDLNMNMVDLNINDYYFSITDQELIGTNGGELIVIPAASTDQESANDYIDKLSKIDFKLYPKKQYLPDIFFKNIQEKLKPDFIFIDSRTGINEIAGILLKRYSSLIFLVFYGNQQNMFGLESVINVIKNDKIPFQLLNSPVPIQETEKNEERNFYIENSYEIINKYILDDKENYPDIYDETSLHYPIDIPYSYTALNINSNKKLTQLLTEGGESNSYKQISRIIENKEIDGTEEELDNIFNVDTKIPLYFSQITNNNIATSEDEFREVSDLIKNFYPRKDYRYIFDSNKFLILGDKGTGKTALFSVLNHEDYTKHLAKYCGVDSDNINESIWITAYDKSGDFPSKLNFNSLMDFNARELANYWILLLIRRMIVHLKMEKHGLDDNIISCKYSELKNYAKDSSISEKIEELLIIFEKVLKERNKKIFFVYDYLDLNIPTENNFRGRCIGELLSIWYDYSARFTYINAKIFLRNDIFDREVNTETDKVKIINHSVDIKWNYDQLLNVVWKRLLSNYTASNEIQNLFRPFESNINFDYKDELGLVPNLTETQNRSLLEMLLGKYMGANNKAFPYNWILYHVSDANRKMFPRSFLTLFSTTGKKQSEDTNTSKVLIRPYNMEVTMNDVSRDRVVDIKEEYPELQNIFDNLKNHIEIFPINEEKLIQGLKKLKEKEPNKIIDKLNDIGVLYPYKYNSKKYGKRYHMPDLYLFGMGLKRRGPGAHKVLFT